MMERRRSSVVGAEDLLRKKETQPRWKKVLLPSGVVQ